MDKIRSVIATEAQLDRLASRLRALIEGKGLSLLVTVTRWRPPKTTSQNALMHVLIRELADHVGYGEEELKQYFKSECGPRKIIEVNGKIYAIPKSMTDYTREEASDMIEQIHRIAAEAGAVVGG